MTFISDSTEIEFCGKDMEEAYQMGRADAIEDALKICKDCNKCQFSIFSNGYYQGCKLERLKEMNND